MWRQGREGFIRSELGRAVGESEDKAGGDFQLPKLSMKLADGHPQQFQANVGARYKTLVKLEKGVIATSKYKMSQKRMKHVAYKSNQ